MADPVGNSHHDRKDPVKVVIVGSSSRSSGIASLAIWMSGILFVNSCWEV